MVPMKQKGKFWIIPAVAIVILLLAGFFLLRIRAHRQLLGARDRILENYRLTRTFTIEHRTQASFYCAKVIPATISSNYPLDPEKKESAWKDIVSPLRLPGTRFRQRVHIGFNDDGSVRCFYTDIGGDQVPDENHPIPRVVLHNRFGEELIFCIAPNGDIAVTEE